MIALYGVYILIMMNNETLKEKVTQTLQAYPITAKLLNSAKSVDGPDDVFGSTSSANHQDSKGFYDKDESNRSYQTTELTKRVVEDDSMFLAACLIVVQHKRLFRSQLRFRMAARYIICKRQHKVAAQKSQNRSNEVNYFGPESEPLKGYSHSNQKERIEAYASSTTLSKNKFSIVSKDDYEFWNRPPEEGESK